MFIGLILVSCFASAVTPGQKAVLLEEKLFPILVKGTSSGECRVPKGSIVTVLAVDGDKILVSQSSISAAWVDQSILKMEPALREAGPTPAVEPVTSPENGVLAKGQEAVGFLKSTLKEIVASPLASELSEKIGYQPQAAPDQTPTTSPPPVTVAKSEAQPANAGEQPAEAEISQGSAVEVFLIHSLLQSWGDSPDARKAAARAVTALKLSDSDLPQDILASLAGVPVKNGKAKGSLQVSIEEEADHRETPGFSTDDIETLKAALSSKERSAVVEVFKKDWTIESGGFRKEKKVPKSGAETVLLTNYESDSFLCRRTKSGRSYETGRLDAGDLRLGGSAFVIATVEWQEETQDAITLPADFHYQKTLIIPNQFAFLALPFEKQLPKGVCAAASMLNVISYMDPGITLGQTELFAMFNEKKAGATTKQMLGGLENMGFETELIPTDSIPKKQLVAKIQASLEDNRPLVVTQPGHALTVIGFNKSTGKIIAWDQRSRGPVNPSGMPKGSFEVTESGFAKRFSEVFILRKAYDKPSRDESEMLAGFTGRTSGFFKHTLVNSNAGKETLPQFARHAIPQKLNAVMRAGRTVLVARGKSEILSLAPQETDDLICTVLPGGESKSFSMASLTRAILDSDGVFYSLSGAKPEN